MKECDETVYEPEFRCKHFRCLYKTTFRGRSPNDAEAPLFANLLVFRTRAAIKYKEALQGALGLL